MMQNHLEISSKLSFGSEMCEISPKVLRKVYVKFTESTESSKTCPGGPIRAHMGPNPDRAPLCKNEFLRIHFRTLFNDLLLYEFGFMCENLRIL